jgi:hypothetical protein
MMRTNWTEPTNTARRPAAPARVSLDSIHAQLRMHAPDLDRASPTFRAAVLLLAAARAGQNIDRLARLTGLPRGFVAQCARRLVDNGVWRNDQTICQWDGEGAAHPAFWSDVAVAEGRVCRRINARGEMEWAAAGVWTKSYEYVRSHEGLTVLYLAPDDEGAGTAPASAADDEDDLADAEEEDTAGDDDDTDHIPPRRRRRLARERPLTRRTPALASSRGKRFHRQQDDLPADSAVSDDFADLFPDAVWLG